MISVSTRYFVESNVKYTKIQLRKTMKPYWNKTSVMALVSVLLYFLCPVLDFRASSKRLGRWRSRGGEYPLAREKHFNFTELILEQNYYFPWILN